jgi:hypothetical protein
VMSSVIPSLKYSCLGSSLMLVNGITTIEGLSGSGNGGCASRVRMGDCPPTEGNDIKLTAAVVFPPRLP